MIIWVKNNMSEKEDKSQGRSVKKPQKNPYKPPKTTYKKVENEEKDKKS